MEHRIEEVKVYKSFVFEGNAREYFRIWMVNIALTILTLGIYSAWAKVRTNRYFYANTYLNGSNFEYNADPIRILIGRLIVVGVYALFIIFFQYLFMFEVAGFIAVVGVLAMPWLIRQAVSFKLRNTSYRNVPFRYSGKIGSFYTFFILHALLNIFTLMLAFPYSYVKFKELIINNAHYGQADFNFKGKAGDVYAIYIQIFIWTTLFIFAVFMVLGLLGEGVNIIFSEEIAALNASLQSTPQEIDPELIGSIVSVFLLFLYILFIFWQKGFVDGYFSNFVRNKTALETAPLKGELKPLTLGWIGTSNIFAIVFSLGLLYPWTKVRYLKYTLEHTSFACQNYDQFESYGYEKGSTVGEEMVDFFDMDIGL